MTPANQQQPQVGAPSPVPPPPGPAGAPMAQPTPNDGARQMGMVQVETAMQMLEKALPVLGSNTPEGQAALKALSTLSSKFQRQQAQELVPAQIAELARSQQQSPLAQLMQQPGAGGAPQGAQTGMPMAA
jgi:hypothetical protein